MELDPLALSIQLAEVESEFEGIVADLEVIRVAPFQLAYCSRRLIVLIHRDLDPR
jgi:hypothetical protein